MIRTIIIDDDPFVRLSLRTILEAQKDVEVVAMGGTGEEAAALFDEHAPDVLLMDIQMPGAGGLEAAERILAAHGDARIVFLTTFSDDEYIVRALRLGARGYLIKQEVATIAPALRSVMAGQSVLGDEVLERVEALVRAKPAPVCRLRARPVRSRRAHRTRARHRGACRRGPRQSRDRCAPLSERGHRPQPHERDPPKARP